MILQKNEFFTFSYNGCKSFIETYETTKVLLLSNENTTKNIVATKVIAIFLALILTLNNFFLNLK